LTAIGGASDEFLQNVVPRRFGESFYEVPHGVHLVSANAGQTEPATFIAYFVCDRDAPLSSDVPENAQPAGR
jgi:hypothetical protein